MQHVSNPKGHEANISFNTLKEINKIAFAQGSHLAHAVLYELNMFHAVH